jgi:ribosomal protein L40E
MSQIRSAKRFCHKCGSEIPEGSTYCKTCHMKWDKPGKVEGHVEEKGK